MYNPPRIYKRKPGNTLYQKEQQRKAAEAMERPFTLPTSDPELERIVGVPGVLYKYDDRVMDRVVLRKVRGRMKLVTGLPLRIFRQSTLDIIRRNIRDMQAGRTTATGMDCHAHALLKGE